MQIKYIDLKVEQCDQIDGSNECTLKVTHLPSGVCIKGSTRYEGRILPKSRVRKKLIDKLCAILEEMNYEE